MDDHSDDIRRPLLPRIEVYAGAGRKHWPDDLKAQIVAESLEPGAIVTAIARRHGCRPQQVQTSGAGRVQVSWCCRLRRIHYHSCLWCRNRRHRRLRSPPDRRRLPLLRLSSWGHGWKCAERLGLPCLVMCLRRCAGHVHADGSRWPHDLRCDPTCRL